jgi:hypothetical protein
MKGCACAILYGCVFITFKLSSLGEGGRGGGIQGSVSGIQDEEVFSGI